MKEPFAIRDATPFEWHTLLSVQKKPHQLRRANETDGSILFGLLNIRLFSAFCDSCRVFVAVVSSPWRSVGRQ